jgi:hypothetical protein
MLVKDLIAELEKLNPEAKIFVPFDSGDDWGWKEVSCVSFRPVSTHSDSQPDYERYWDEYSRPEKPIAVIA